MEEKTRKFTDAENDIYGALSDESYTTKRYLMEKLPWGKRPTERALESLYERGIVDKIRVKTHFSSKCRSECAFLRLSE